MSRRAMSSVALRTAGITAGYRESVVLRGVSFEVHAGEMLAVIGPNGAGKSTLLRVLGGSLAPQSGGVELMGRPVGEYDRRALARI
jgi:iron complex transport system ATP-binding protein